MRKKLEALGSSCARSVGTDAGSFNKPGRAAIIPDATVTIKNEC